MSDARGVVPNCNDNDAGRYLVTRLTPAGYEVPEATNGREALASVGIGPILVVLDMNLADTPASVDRLESGFDLHPVKPVQPEKLHGILVDPRVTAKRQRA